MPATGREAGHGTQPWFPTEARRSKRTGSYGAWFSIPFEQGERGDRRESAHAHRVAGGEPAQHAPQPASSELDGEHD